MLPCWCPWLAEQAVMVLTSGEATMTSVPTLVLVHGRGTAPWCWEQLSGVELRAVALSSSGSDPSKLGDLYQAGRLYDDSARV
jgi:hypothetical protein